MLSGCGAGSARGHDRCRRRIADLAMGGRAVTIVRPVRRFHCESVGCPRRIFTPSEHGGLSVSLLGLRPCQRSTFAWWNQKSGMYEATAGTGVTPAALSLPAWASATPAPRPNSTVAATPTTTRLITMVLQGLEEVSAHSGPAADRRSINVSHMGWP
ncbi:transposase family protein [Kitasatospora sp. NPDC008050]|uniref:transposase family protein n=1 Tax=Kitasatospora sp. NPDC008050 TaxID=3364021 RepID=UPI0036E9CDBA